MNGAEYKTQRKQLLEGVLAYLRQNGLTYGQALITLKDAQSFLESASLRNQF